MKLHNHVNETTGKPIFTKDQYAEKYGAKQKATILLETQNCFNELEVAWLSMDFFKTRIYDFAAWKRSFVMLRALLQ